MWEKFDGSPYTREQFIAMVEKIPLDQLRWVKFLTTHNTASPSIAQWMGKVKPQQRIINLQNYYEDTLGWRSGPHAFIPPSETVCCYGFTPFTTKGVHASCFNQISIGLEMVGDFDTEDFNSGYGAIVRDNTVFVLAVLHNKLSLRPDGYVYGQSGLHLHRDCKRDNHACPGKTVNRDALVKAVLAKMEELKTPKVAPGRIPVADANLDGILVPNDGLPPQQVANAASPVGASMISRIASTTASAAAINELADQGSRLGGFIRKVKQWFWGGVATTATTAGVASKTVDPEKGNAAIVIAWVNAHPLWTATIVGLTLGVLIYLIIKRVEKWTVTAYLNGRYAPRQED